MNKKAKWWLSALGIVVVGGVLAVWYAGVLYQRALEPMPKGEAFLVRYDGGISFIEAVQQLVDQGVIKDERAFRIYSKRNDKEISLKIGTYQFNPGMSVEQVLTAMQTPVSQMVRVKEGRWIAQVAKVLEENDVCTAEEYIALANNPSHFEGTVDFPLPEDSLEGYLYPDTYDFPPLYGAENAIRTMLATFESKVWNEFKDELSSESSGTGQPPTDSERLQSIVTMASIIELEAGIDKDRPLIAGVIDNRIRANMTLDMDATIMYALQEWRKLEAGETKRIESEYNTYLNRGLPPGPIGSPAVRSIKAAISPAVHKFYYYYVPPGSMEHIFTTSYANHRRAIRNPQLFMPPPQERVAP